MNGKTLKYELTTQEVQYLLMVLDKVQIVGTQSARNLVAMETKLQNPSNAEELEKAQLEDLKSKYEPKEKNNKK